MKKCTLLSGLILFIHLLSFGQIEQFEMDWSDTIIPNQKIYWPGGSIKGENLEKDGNVIRNQYYEDGTLQLTCKIIQYRQIDTIITIDPMTMEDTMIIVKSFGDVPVGDFKSYYPNGKLESKGSYIDGKKAGIWLYYYDNGKKKEVISYDKEGRKFGEYKAYYENGNIKIIGEYAVQIVLKKERVGMSKDSDEEYFVIKKHITEIKTGEWIYYKTNGKVKKKIVYD